MIYKSSFAESDERAYKANLLTNYELKISRSLRFSNPLWEVSLISDGQVLKEDFLSESWPVILFSDEPVLKDFLLGFFSVFLSSKRPVFEAHFLSRFWHVFLLRALIEVLTKNIKCIARLEKLATNYTATVICTQKTNLLDLTKYFH